MDHVELKPIAIYYSATVNPYEAARQPRANDSRPGEIHFSPPLSDLQLAPFQGADWIWVVFHFHENAHWKPMVLPPRGTSGKIGVFATRAPYRPNPIGLSCVRVVTISSTVFEVRGADLLNETPIFDVKPYVAETDSRINAKSGWLEGLKNKAYDLSWTETALEKLEFLRGYGITQLEDFAIQQLEFEPFDDRRKRVSAKDDSFILAYRTWRIFFRPTSDRSLEIFDLSTGYSEFDLENSEDRWNDKDLHRRFLLAWPPKRVP